MRILQLTNYPTANPLHGGQIRCQQIATQLRSCGHEVLSIAIYPEPHYGDADVNDIPFPCSSPFWNYEFPWASDYFTGLFAVGELDAFSALENKVNTFNPHVIISEQPWLFNVARQLAKDDTKLVYSSQNIEWRLKENMASREGATAKQLINEIKQVEINAVANSHLTVVCTQSDAEYYGSLFDASRTKSIVVAGNGVEPFSCEDARVDDWRGYFDQPYPVFVSSAHPPNAEGFWDMLAPGLTFLKPYERVVVIGGVSSILTQCTGFKTYEDVNISRINLTGLREKNELQAMVRASHVVLLPITVGEGSNLKTAEALESGCPIIATTKAFRGYEAGMALPHVIIADTSDDFRRAIRKVLDSPRQASCTPKEDRAQYYWQQQLRSMSDAISKFKNSSS